MHAKSDLTKKMKKKKMMKMNMKMKFDLILFGVDDEIGKNESMRKR